MVESSSVDISDTYLPDPCNDRVIADTQCPKLAHKPLDDAKFWVKEGVPNWKMLREFLCREGPVTKQQCVRVLKSVLEVFKKEPNLV